jgi:hypothetical protein
MIEPCKICGNAGIIVRDNGSAETCRCTVLRSWLTTIRRTPGLERVERLGRGCVDFEEGGRPLSGSMVIRSLWAPMLDNTAGWLFASAQRGSHPKVLITSCADLRLSYLGGEEDRSGSQLRGLRDYDLVVVRLLGVRNRLTPDALLEAQSYAKSMWLVHSPGRAWGRSHPAWSPELDEETSSWKRLDLAPAADEEDILEKLGIATEGGQK